MHPILQKTSLALAAAGALALLAPAAHAAGEAKNVIFFLGDGMGPVTVTAARIYKGEKLLAQKPGSLTSSERAALTMQTLPYASRIKTFSRDGQTTDSAPSMAAYMTGVKMNNEVISMSAETLAYAANGQQFINGEDSTCQPGNGQPAQTLLELSKAKGRAVGAVSTTRVGHATPAATYAHICNRNGYNTIAEQSVPGHANYNTKLGDGIDVLMGGGQRNYLPKSVNPSSKRTDAANLVDMMKARGYAYVAKGSELAALDATKAPKLLGLFTQSEMAYELDRVKQKLDEPSLSDMTSKALDVLSRNDKGFFLMVEGGRIDHALHGTNAKRALEDTLAFDRAIETAMAYMEKKDPGLKNTLIVVTADHDHNMVFNGYSRIGNPILGKVQDYQTGQVAKAQDGKPYTTLAFGNGGRPNATASSQVNPEDGNKPWIAPARGASRDDVTNVDTTDDNYLQEVGLNLGTPGSETHGGGDVMLFAGGAGARIFKGTMDNTRVFSKVREAAGL
ncbi:Alkaline phosphatase 3 precursor [Delftia tsuruhatensis]|uniref:alkaline phosphatase n=1 Tax=Delftia tsuruhatensis TaxID=180282 RepID=UPI001E6D0AF8|nr:alkaline phosphatase [Delftia tsuruhatensis]CAB5665175.1 Alkaline phosphatase 3 precursor [Delftia tsuruhatensis]CAC9677528.1 Alkaline phosphatase 3 precursor [Delftia tsuruhatensis]